MSMKVLAVVAAMIFAFCGFAHARNATCMLVFGDSTVDPGNNNRLSTSVKANFLPYGKDFLHGKPTGRFCDGKLATDFIAESLGVSRSVPAFLDPNLIPKHLKHGVSFASASSGYDEQTATEAGVISLPRQINYMKHYKVQLTKLVGPMRAQKIISNAVIVISAGTNDFIENYYFYPNRSAEFTVSQYQDYLVSLVSDYIKEINRLGGKKIVLVGVPPMGCLPIVRTLMGSQGCYEKFNKVAISFNSKIKLELSALSKQLGLKAAYLNIYRVFKEVAKYPEKYGFEETQKGCCGSGVIEFGQTCKGQSICDDPTKYMYWDAIHPTQKFYKIIADVAMKQLRPEILG